VFWLSHHSFMACCVKAVHALEPLPSPTASETFRGLPNLLGRGSE